LRGQLAAMQEQHGSALMAAQQAADDTQSQERLAAVSQEAEDLRAQIAELRSTFESEREEARKAAEDSREEIEALRLAAQELAEGAIKHDSDAADAYPADHPASAELEQLRATNAQLQADLEAERESARASAEQAAGEIAALRANSGDDDAELANQLTELRQRLDTLDQDLSDAEAARYSAEFERDEARKQAADAASRLAALKITQVSHHSSTPVFGAAEPLPIKSSTAAATFDAALADDDVAADEDELDQEFAEAAEARAAHDAGEFLEGDRHDAPPSHSEDQEDTIASGELPKSKTSHADRRSASQAPIPHAPTGTDLAIYETSQPDNSHIVTSDPQETAERRGREKRVPSRMPVTLWREEWGQPLSCFLVDKSSRGAKIEMKPDRIFGGTNRISVGERLTLTFYYAQERTSVFCDVMWMNGNFLGVKYYGQFHTEIVKPRKPGKA
ncbi:MAG: hypothetical protein KDE45_22300, partial [Caldilineaceae bacterium]|nr:hypothetical protein [Caldilineaceae bacterium]